MDINWSEMWFDKHTVLHIDMKNKDRLAEVFKELLEIDALSEKNFENLIRTVKCLNDIEKVI